MKNFDAWHLWNENLESAEKFISLSFYGMISTALDKRIWIHGHNPWDRQCIWSNLFLLFVGPPAAGKTRSALSGWDILSVVKNPDGSPAYFKSPDNVSEAALLRKLNKSLKQWKIPGVIDPYEFHSLYVVSEELGTLIKGNDVDTANSLIQLYDSRGYAKETITSDSYDMKSIIVNMIACTNTDWVKTSFNESLISGGFISRFIPCYAPGPRFQRDSYGDEPQHTKARNQIIEHVEKLSKLFGRVDFTDRAKAYRKHIIEHPKDNYLVSRVNDSEKVAGYYSRKRLHWFKLSMAMHFSESLEMIIDRPVMERAYELLESNEQDMMRIFEGLAKNGAAQYYENVLATITKAPRGLSTGALWASYSSDLNRKQLEEVTDYLITTGKVTREGDRYYPKAEKGAKPSKPIPDMTSPDNAPSLIAPHLNSLRGALKA